MKKRRESNIPVGKKFPSWQSFFYAHKIIKKKLREKVEEMVAWEKGEVEDSRTIMVMDMVQE